MTIRAPLGRATPGASIQPVDRSDRGDTLVEVLMGLIVLSITVLGLIIAFGTSLSASVEHRDLASNDIVLRSAAENALSQIQQQATPLYQSCASPSYYSTHVNFGLPSSTYSATFTSVTYWDAALDTFVSSPCSSNAPELLSLQVTNTTSGSHLLTNFVVDARGQNSAPAVSVTGVSPSSLRQGTSQNLSLTGTGFAPGATATFSNSGITVNSSTFTSSSTTAGIVNVSVSGTASLGSSTITVTNLDGTTATSAAIFTVTPGLSVTSVSPSSLLRGASNVTLSLTGTGFVSGTTVTFSNSGVTVNSSTFTNANPTSASVNVSVSGSAPTGTGTITVTNPDGTAATSGGIFTITPTSTVLDVNLMIGSYDGTSKHNWDALVTIDVVDSHDNAVAGVVITGSWNNAVGTSTSTCTTNATGSCTVEDGMSLNLGSSNASVTFTVSNLSLSGYTYNVAGNFASPASATVSKP